jgi:hypothetical protein
MSLNFLKDLGKPPVIRPKWNTELSRGDMDQVDELRAIKQRIKK